MASTKTSLEPSISSPPQSSNAAEPERWLDTRRARRKVKRAAERAVRLEAEGAAAAGARMNATLVSTEVSGPLENGFTQAACAPNGGGKTMNGENGVKFSTKATFEQEDEFIPFTFSDVSEAEETSRRRQKDGKGKGRAVDLDDEDPDRENSRRRRGKEKDREDGEVVETTLSKSKSGRGHERDKGSGRGKEKEDEDRRRSSRKDGDQDRRSDRSHKRRYDEYDDDDRYGSRSQRRDLSSKKCPWVEGVDFEKCPNVAEMMHLEVESFVDWISPSPVEDEIRGLIVDHISRVVTTSFPDAQVFPFGSYQTKLYLPTGDIDLVVLSDTMAYSDKTTVLHILANTLKRSGITSHVTIIAKAKVPIVKFVSTHGRFKVDISVNQGNGLVSGKIISGFLRDMIPCGEGLESKALRSLVMITKAFLSQRSMNEVYTGGLGSYSVVCLAVSFLQMHPKIRRGEIDPEKNLGVLVMEFFELYGNYFNYDEVGISLREGGTYFSKRQRGWNAEYKRASLSIEDPADPSNDISSGSYNFHKVKTAFSGAHGILTSTAYLRAGMLSSRQRGRSIRLRDHYDPEDLSILSTVMGITQETINHRKLVRELYDRRVLHDILGVLPRPTLGQAPLVLDNKRADDPQTSFSPARNSHVVKSAWREERVNEDADYDYGEHRSGHRQQSAHDEERGRYDIGRQPPKKRRKTGRSEDAHTVLFVDDDEESRSERYDRADELEDGGYASMSMSEDHDEDARASRSANGKRNRSFWLSKGIGVGSTPEDST